MGRWVSQKLAWEEFVEGGVELRIGRALGFATFSFVRRVGCGFCVCKCLSHCLLNSFGLYNSLSLSCA